MPHIIITIWNLCINANIAPPNNSFFPVISTSKGSEQPEDQTLSGLSTLTNERMANIPKPLLRLAGWLSDSSPVVLVAELMEAECIRLHFEADVRVKITALRARLKQSASPDRLELIAVAEDRYHDVKLYVNEINHTVCLPELVTEYLNIQIPGKQADRRLFLQAQKSIIYLMTYRGRAARQERLRDETSI